MRRITKIVVHCSATPQNATTESIKRYWKNVLGWRQPGYHYLVHADGRVEKLLDEAEVSNGVAGYNSSIVNVCYIGGVDATGVAVDNRTVAQRGALTVLLREISARYPGAEIVGHRDFVGVRKACPCFDARGEYRNF